MFGILAILGGLIITGFLSKKGYDNYYMARRIRNKAFNGPAPDDQDYHRNISNRFHQILQNNPNFVWQGAPIYFENQDLEVFLNTDVNDNPQYTVFCRHITNMLELILTSAAPQDGIGLPAGDVNIVNYDNHGLGFFANQHGDVLRSQPNVFALNGQTQNLRFWGSHRVVRVRRGGVTRWYDPSYGASQHGANGEYNLPADMAAANIARTFEIVGNTINGIYVERVHFVAAPPNLRGYYLLCQRRVGGLRDVYVGGDVAHLYVTIGPIVWDDMPINLDGANFVAQMPHNLQLQLAQFN